MSLSPEGDSICGHGEFHDDLDLLRQIYFFSGLNPEALKIMAYLSCRQRFQAGDYIFRQNDDDGQAIYILKGRVQLLYENHAPSPPIREYEAEQFLGGLSLLGKMRRLFSLKAATNTCCLVLTREKFSKALEQYPAIMPVILNAVTNRIRVWEQNFLLDTSTAQNELKDHIGVSLL
ncbi:MAG: cyclic nucleotide-binding domain-containing protein [Desulfobacterales bacterium]|nr:cyclic nucleotide-binding domain-containing protein [Desulfobacterales bacterium]MDD4070873.1 cyclic nucleotide-binding domain-containing protein [Desulfobacterales bacterium]MDD4392880.1 cyclic nucleotide-binding domain-containing protein [Desulfobacterales bacterium]